MAKSKKAAPKKSAKKAAPTSDDAKTAVPSKLTLVKKAGGAAPKDVNDRIAKIAARIQQDSDRDYVTRGQLNLYLTAVTGIAEDTEDARILVANAIDAGALKAA